MASAQTVGDDSNPNVHTERRLWLQIYSYGFLIKGEKSEDRFPCFALAAENLERILLVVKTYELSKCWTPGKL